MTIFLRNICVILRKYLYANFRASFAHEVRISRFIRFRMENEEGLVLWTEKEQGLVLQSENEQGLGFRMENEQFLGFSS